MQRGGGWAGGGGNMFVSIYFSLFSGEKVRDGTLLKRKLYSLKRNV